MPVKSETVVGKFGKIALELGLVSLDQIQECLSVQMDYERSGKEVPKLGTILLAKGYLNSAQVKKILDKQNQEKDKLATTNASSFVEKCKAGAVIFKEGQSGASDLYLIQEGTVELSKRKVVLHERCGPGNFLGITGCLLKTPRSATAKAKTDCTLYRIPEAQAQTFFKSRPEMAIKLATVLAKNLFTIKNQYVQEKLNQSQPAPASKPDSTSVTFELSGGNTLKVAELSGDVPVNINSKRAGIGTSINPGDSLEIFGVSLTGESVQGATSETADIIPEAQELASTPADQPLPESDEKSPAEDEDSEPKDSLQPDEQDVSEDDAPDDEPSQQKPKQLEIEAPKPKAELAVFKDLDSILSQIDQLENVKLSKEIISATAKRIDLLLQIEKLEERRQEYEESEQGLTDQAKNEINRQRREAQRIPPREALENSRQKLKDRLNPPPPQNEEEEEKQNNMPPLEPIMIELYTMAIEQKDILLERDDSTAPLLQTCMEAAVNEPLYAIFAKHDIPAHTLFGWGIFAMALKEYAEAQTPRIKEIRKELNAVNEQKGSGFLGLGKKKVDDEHLQKLEEEEKRRKLISTNINRELNSIEKDMVNCLWDIYEAAALKLVEGLDAGEEPFVRGFLRWGLLGHSPRWMPTEKCKQIITDCATILPDPEFKMDSDHVYYADELIQFIAHGKLPPTANEDLELNHRNTDLWRADRAWRKVINNTMQLGLLRDIMGNIDSDAKKIRKDQQAAEHEFELVNKRANDKERRKAMSQIRHQIQNFKVKAGRLERIVEKMQEETIPRLVEETGDAQSNLQDSPISFSPKDLAMHEIKCMRRNARLVAKLKEPFLPFTLAERYKPENKCTNDRASALESLQDVQMRDPLIFKEPLIPNAKKIHRILMRTPPIVIIAPANGILGFMMSPRTTSDCGRIVLPAYFERANMREDILWNVLSDFRFDTSKASAGVDVMNSDTLVAAYAEVRWNLRKRDKEVRQKAAIYMEENERTNWRRHYSIYMKSALDSGKLLFYKCPELYELIINKFIDLPGGCEILKR